MKFEFEAIQINMQILSHDKIIFHMLFEAFHITSHTYVFSFAMILLIFSLDLRIYF